MEKKTITVFGKKSWLLGQDEDGINYYLEEPSWDCGWYWGFGYVETYTNNRNPEKSKDISSHQHFNGLFFEGSQNGYDMFKEFFVKTPLTDDEIWKLLDFMKTFYTLRETSELFGFGYSHYTEKSKLDDLKRDDLVKLINKDLLPKLFKEIESIFE